MIELMVAMALGLVIVLAASMAFLAGKKLFNTDTDVQAVQDSLRFTRYVVQSLIRQSGYRDFAPDHLTDGMGVVAGNPKSGSLIDLNVAGASNTTVNGNGESFGENDTDSKSRNDSLMVRFFGRSSAGDAAKPDGTMIDCLGNPQPGPPDTPSADARSSSYFYVRLASDGEPELYCKYKADAGGFSSGPLARGVEKFKVVYGYDGNGDTVPEAWLDANGIAAKAASGGNANEAWRKVVAVRVGIVVRSLRPNGDLKQIAGQSASYRLFPLGSEFTDVVFDPPDDGRFRAVATFTVMLRNVNGDPA
ncbi:PilW family protein [Variovorax sp. J22P240]|nr:PilW family protein [Variovorax sp. J22P240]MDM0001281.1 PilW family protein [Variovorax sp. J22P240]